MDCRIGYCCKLLPEHVFDTKKHMLQWVESHNGKSTTVANLDKLSYSQAVEKVRHIIAHNQQALLNQFKVISTWPHALRMVRIGSEQLPVRTFERYKRIYDEPVIIAQQQHWQQVGDVARSLDLRLSSHPGQFCIITSDKPEIVSRAIEDLEYHAELFRLMGYDSSDQRQEINIHGGPKRTDFQERWRSAIKRLSADTRAWLSVENDEYSYGLDDLLGLADVSKICVDINHYWLKEGTYLDPSDSKMNIVIDSWRGARPEIHVSYPKEDILGAITFEDLPQMQLLQEAGFSVSKLRAHSDMAWIKPITHYALSFWDKCDLMIEAKLKNLAAYEVFKAAQESTSI